MPYTVTGDDSTGMPVQGVMDDAGAVTGDALLVNWLASEPLPPVPFEGATPTDAELEQCRQHVSRLLINPTITQMPFEPVAPLSAPPPEGPPNEQAG